MMFWLLIFVLAAFLGFELIRKVPSQLHTPLMSGANAISGVTLVGALAAITQEGGASGVLAAIAAGAAAINVFGGYAVTDRMLRMFRTQNEAQASAPSVKEQMNRMMGPGSQGRARVKAAGGAVVRSVFPNAKKGGDDDR
jgi:NAD(P) transhydrogenase subunit alpha